MALAPSANTTPSSVLSAPLIVAVDPGPSARPLPAGNVLTLVDFAGEAPVVTAANGRAPFALHHLPLHVVAVASGEPRGARTERFLHWMETRGAPTPPPVLAWVQGGEADALRRLGAELQKLAQAGAARQSQTRQEVRRLQAMNAELRYRFAVSEGLLARRGKAPFELAFANDPASAPAQLISLAEYSAGLAQILPVPTTGVSALAFHLAGEPDASAEIQAELRSLEDAAVLERWSVAGKALRPGWNLLGLPRALSGHMRTLELRLAARGDGPLVSLSLGAEQPIPSFQVRELASNRPAMTNGLAVQVWRGLPGVCLPSFVSANLPARVASQRGGYTERPLSPAALKRVEHVNADVVRFEFPAVVAPPGEGAIVCHPPSIGITVGGIAGVVPGTALRASATVHIDNEKSHAVDFALVVAADVARARAMIEGGLPPERDEAFSGWHQVGRVETRRISAFRAAGSEEPASLFIATRMSEPGDNSYAWARFKDFTTLLQPV